MDQAIHEFVLSVRVCVVAKKPLVVNPLSVSVQPCGKKRLILDLRPVNKCLLKQRVKFEDWKVARQDFRTGPYLLNYAYTPLFQENNSENNRRPLGLWRLVLSS